MAMLLDDDDDDNAKSGFVSCRRKAKQIGQFASLGSSSSSRALA